MLVNNNLQFFIKNDFLRYTLSSSQGWPWPCRLLSSPLSCGIHRRTPPCPIYRGVLIEKLAKVLLTLSQSEFPGNNAHSSNIVERIDKQRRLCPHIQAHWRENVCRQSEIVSEANSCRPCNFQRSLLLWISIAGSPLLTNRNSMTSLWICAEV